jgi:hypothetical protein
MELTALDALWVAGLCIKADYTFHKFCIVALQLFDRFAQLWLRAGRPKTLQLIRRIYATGGFWLVHGGRRSTEHGRTGLNGT